MAYAAGGSQHRQPEATHERVHQTITIRATPNAVFDFVANIETLPQWAVVFCQKLRRDGSRWIVTTPGGEMTLRYASDPRSGVVDMYTSVAGGEEDVAYSRVIPNGDGSEYVFTFFQTSDISDQDFARMGAALKKELGVLKGLLEKRS
ncbi:MAG: SRPBCC family protein [Nitrospirota bacterium]